MCGTYTIDVLAPVLVRLDYDLDGDVRAVLLEELAQHLTLKHGTACVNKSSLHKQLNLLTSGRKGWVALLAIT